MEAGMYESALSHLRKQLYLKLCVVCLTEPRQMIFVHPNGVEHTLCCSDCAAQLQSQRQPCPICREPLGRLDRADGPVDRTMGAPRAGRRARVLEASELSNMPWAVDLSNAVQLRDPAPDVVTDALPLELELRPEQLIPPRARPEGMAAAEHVLGDGAFGAVYLARRNGVKLAAKTFHAFQNPAAYDLDQPQNMRLVLEEVMVEVNCRSALAPRGTPASRSVRFPHLSTPREFQVNMLVAVEHANIIKFAGIAFKERNGVTIPKWIFSEFAGGGTLHSRIYASTPLSYTLMAKYSKETMNALAYLHDDLKTVHRDLKPKNVLLSVDNRIKIGDLGIAKVCSRLPQQSAMYGVISAAGGTPIYNAPECSYAGEAWGPPRDVYAWGLIAAEMVLQQSPSYWRPLPADDQRDGHAFFTSRAVPRAGSMASLIRDCTAEEPRDRPTAAQLHSRL
jgi:hypothetical protein